MKAKLLVLTALTLWGCSSTQKAPLFDEEQMSGSAYYGFYKNQDPDFQRTMARSPFHLLRANQDPFNARVHQATAKQPLMTDAPQTIVHGDFHLQQMAWEDNARASLDDFDTPDLAPWWIDLVRMEMSSLVAAKQVSLKGEVSGACWDAYVSGLSKLPADPSLAPLSPPLQPLPADHLQEATWTKAKQSVSDETQAKIKTWLASLPWSPARKKATEFRAGRSGVGSYGVDKIYILNGERRLLELKEQSAVPLRTLAQAQQAGKLSACARWIRGAKAFAPSEDAFCWENEGRAYALLSWALSYWSPDPENFNNLRELRSHVGWMCRELSTVHARNWSEADRKRLALTLRMNAQFKGRVLALARSEAAALDQAYRMILFKP
jgi:hypothetical protein